MKFIFLDIDGVMVHQNYVNCKGKYGFTLFDPQCVERLKQIISATDAKIVVSSSWRKSSDIFHIMRENGLRMFGKTPNFKDVERGMEIKCWLQTHLYKGIESFVILDDDDDMGDLLPYLVQTSWYTGITDDHVKWAIEILNREANT